MQKPFSTFVYKYKHLPILLLAVVFLIQCNNTPKKDNHYTPVSEVLDNIVAERKNQLFNYLDITRANAQAISQDEVMRNFFIAKQSYYQISKNIEVPSDIVADINLLKKNIQKHYLNNYQQFYDILFIDKKGDIFYTIRKEKDYHKNVFSDEFLETELSKRLMVKEKESFVDFQFYKISGEPSAFFIEPFIQGDEFHGWFVLQFAINKIDNIFLDNSKLGSTGEIILVNKEHYMLTNSRFKKKSTILRQKLSDKNIESKFKERKGHKTVVDYNGKKVMTSFEVFPFLGSEWLIIAKINQGEVITNYYKKHPKELNPILHKPQVNTKENYKLNHPQKVIRVDMDEYKRTDSTGVLYTHGVSTCTVVVISYPGKFSYMAHISPYDDIYGQTRTDILSQMLKRIEYLELLKYEKPELEFAIVAIHDKTAQRAVEKIVDAGYHLDQIKFIYNNRAVRARVKHSAINAETMVYWEKSKNVTVLNEQCSAGVLSLGQLLLNHLSATGKAL